MAAFFRSSCASCRSRATRSTFPAAEISQPLRRESSARRHEPVPRSYEGPGGLDSEAHRTDVPGPLTTPAARAAAWPKASAFRISLRGATPVIEARGGAYQCHNRRDQSGRNILEFRRVDQVGEER